MSIGPPSALPASVNCVCVHVRLCVQIENMGISQLLFFFIIFFLAELIMISETHVVPWSYWYCINNLQQLQE